MSDLDGIGGALQSLLKLGGKNLLIEYEKDDETAAYGSNSQLDDNHDGIIDPLEYLTAGGRTQLAPEAFLFAIALRDFTSPKLHSADEQEKKAAHEAREQAKQTLISYGAKYLQIIIRLCATEQGEVDPSEHQAFIKQFGEAGLAALVAAIHGTDSEVRIYALKLLALYGSEAKTAEGEIANLLLAAYQSGSTDASKSELVQAAVTALGATGSDSYAGTLKTIVEGELAKAQREAAKSDSGQENILVRLHSIDFPVLSAAIAGLFAMGGNGLDILCELIETGRVDAFLEDSLPSSGGFNYEDCCSSLDEEALFQIAKAELSDERQQIGRMRPGQQDRFLSAFGDYLVRVKKQAPETFGDSAGYFMVAFGERGIATLLSVISRLEPLSFKEENLPASTYIIALKKAFDKYEKLGEINIESVLKRIAEGSGPEQIKSAALLMLAADVSFVPVNSGESEDENRHFSIPVEYFIKFLNNRSESIRQAAMVGIGSRLGMFTEWTEYSDKFDEVSADDYRGANDPTQALISLTKNSKKTLSDGTVIFEEPSSKQKILAAKLLSWFSGRLEERSSSFEDAASTLGALLFDKDEAVVLEALTSLAEYGNTASFPNSIGRIFEIMKTAKGELLSACLAALNSFSSKQTLPKIPVERPEEREVLVAILENILSYSEGDRVEIAGVLSRVEPPLTGEAPVEKMIESVEEITGNIGSATLSPENARKASDLIEILGHLKSERLLVSLGKLLDPALAADDNKLTVLAAAFRALAEFGEIAVAQKSKLIPFLPNAEGKILPDVKVVGITPENTRRNLAELAAQVAGLIGVKAKDDKLLLAGLMNGLKPTAQVKKEPFLTALGNVAKGLDGKSDEFWSAVDVLSNFVNLTEAQEALAGMGGGVLTILLTYLDKKYNPSLINDSNLGKVLGKMDVQEFNRFADVLIKEIAANSPSSGLATNCLERLGRKAKESGGKIKVDRAIAGLKTLLTDEAGQLATKKAACLIAGQYGPLAQELVPVLMELYLREKQDPELSVNAKIAINGIGTPAVKYLEIELRKLARDGSAEEKIGKIFSLLEDLPGGLAEIVPVIVRCLSNPSTRVRDAAIGLIKKSGAAAETTIKELGDIAVNSKELLETRLKAIELLALIGRKSQKAVAILKNALDDDLNVVKEAAAKALGEMGAIAAPALPALMDLFTEKPRPENETLRKAALVSFIQVGSEVFPGLKDDDREKVNSKLQRTFSKIPSLALLGQVIDENPAIIKKLVALAPALVAVFVEAIDDKETELTDKVKDLLSRIGSSAVPALATQLERSKGNSEFLRSLKTGILDLLGPMKGKARAALGQIAVLMESKDEIISAKAKWAWGLIFSGSQGAIGSCLKDLASRAPDNAPEVIEAKKVLSSLGEIALQEITPIFTSANRANAKTRIRLAGAIADMNLDLGEIIPLFVSQLNDMDIRNDLALIMVSMGDKIIPFLLAALAKETDKFRKMSLLGILSAMGPKAAASMSAAVELSMHAADIDIRITAVDLIKHAAKGLPATDLSDVLRDLKSLAQSPNPDVVRAKAILALGELGDASHLDFIQTLSAVFAPMVVRDAADQATQLIKKRAGIQ